MQFHYFTRKQEDEETKIEVSSPVIDHDGRLNAWPNGFFDEIDKSLEQLLSPKPGLKKND